MKKNYRKPLVERIEFAYGDQIAAESTPIEYCKTEYGHVKAYMEGCISCDSMPILKTW